MSTVVTVAKARELLGLSQSELARRAGLSKNDIADLESGRNRRPSWVVVGRIVAALREAGMAGITPEQLFPLERETKAS